MTRVNFEVNMLLRPVHRDVWEVVAVCDARGRCEVVERLECFPEQWRNQLLGVLYRVATRGRLHSERWRAFPDRAEGIGELKTKKLRLFAFQDGPRFVCCLVMPKGDLTKRSSYVAPVEKAARIRREYLKAKAAGSLEFVEPSQG